MITKTWDTDIDLMISMGQYPKYARHCSAHENDLHLINLYLEKI